MKTALSWIQTNEVALTEALTHQPAARQAKKAFVGRLGSYSQLVKWKLTTLVVFTTAMGYLLATSKPVSVALSSYLLTLLGTFLVVGAANAANQIMERETDGLMARTKDRPLPSHRLSVTETLFVTGAMLVAGLTLLAFVANTLTAGLAAVAFLLYVFAYTPLKGKTEFCILVGAISGALPPVLGWTAAQGTLSSGAALLFAFQFLWQFPHLWAIAWIYREDYQRVGFHLLPAKGQPSVLTRLTIFCTAALVPLSLFPAFADSVSPLFWFGVLALNAWLLTAAVRFAASLSNHHARRFLGVVDLYLAAWLLCWLVCR